MNERITQLAEQARKYARDYVSDCKHYGYYMEHNEYDLQFEKKFAELIVNECSAKIERDYKYERGEDTKWIIAFAIANDLKEHFGVEE